MATSVNKSEDNSKQLKIKVSKEIKNAHIFINEVERDSISVEKGTIISWRVNAPEYHEQLGDIKLVSDWAFTVQLVPLSKKPYQHKFMKIRPSKGVYAIEYLPLFKETLPPVAGHDKEYLYTEHGYLWWKKGEISPLDIIVQTTGDDPEKVISQKAMTQFLNNKANTADVYSRAVIDDLLSTKVDDADMFKNIDATQSACVIKGVDSLTQGDKVLFHGYTFEVGKNAFSTIAKALQSSYKTILLQNNEYTEDVSITKKDTKLIGFGNVVLNGKITVDNCNGLLIKNIKVIYDTTTAETVTDSQSAVLLKGTFESASIEDVDIIVNGTAHALVLTNAAKDFTLSDSRLVAGTFTSGDTVEAIIAKGLTDSTITRNSILGNVITYTTADNVVISENNLTVINGDTITFKNCMLKNKITVMENRAYGHIIKYALTLDKVVATNLTQFIVVGNFVAYNNGFVHLLNGATGLTNDKFNLSFNLANNASNSKYFIDDNTPATGLTPDDGNICASGQSITKEEVEGLINLEKDRAVAIETGLRNDIDEHILDLDNPHNVTKAQLGLGNVDNTSDANKPISTATQTALDSKLEKKDLPTRLPNPTPLEIICNNKFVCEYYGGESETEVIADIHLDMDNVPQVSYEIAALKYTPYELTQFTGGGIFAKMQVLTEEERTVTWEPKEIHSLTVKAIEIVGVKTFAITDRSYTFDSITEDKDYTIKITYTDGGRGEDEYLAVVESTISFEFKETMYSGTSEKTSLTQEEVLALDQDLIDEPDCIKDFNCQGGKYFYFVIPASMTEDINMYYGGILLSDMNISDMTITNQHGYQNDFKVYRSNNKQTSKSIMITVN